MGAAGELVGLGAGRQRLARSDSDHRGFREGRAPGQDAAVAADRSGYGGQHLAGGGDFEAGEKV